MMTVTDAIRQLVYVLQSNGIAGDGTVGIALPTHDDGMRLSMQLRAENKLHEGSLVDGPSPWRDPNSLEIFGVKVVWPDRRTGINPLLKP